VQTDEPFFLWERKWSKKDRVQHAEDGGVGADAESERENSNGGEARGLAEHAESEAEILHKSFEKLRAAGVAAVLFLLFEPAGFESSAVNSFFAREAALDQFLDLTLEMEAELVVEFGLDFAAIEE